MLLYSINHNANKRFIAYGRPMQPTMHATMVAFLGWWLELGCLVVIYSDIVDVVGVMTPPKYTPVLGVCRLK